MATPKNMKKTQRGGTRKSVNNDGMAVAIARYKARRAKRLDEAENPPSEGLTPEELVQLVKDRRDRRDAEGDPETTEAAMGTIAQQDEDLDTLLGVIDTLMAANDLGLDCDTTKNGDEDDPDATAADGDDENCDEGEDPENQDGDEENGDEGEDPEAQGDEDEEQQDEGEEDPEAPAPPATNADSRSALSEHLKVCRIGDKLNLDGLDRMSLLAAKKAVIRKVRPGVRLDGKGATYINAAYDMVVQEVTSRKSTSYQRQQMMGGGKRTRGDSADTGADAARKRMMARNANRNGGNK